MNEKDKLPEMSEPHFQPSPTKQVRFSDGKVFAMNRKLRRKYHIKLVKR